MNDQIDKALKSLRDALQAGAHPHCTAAKIFINHQGYEITYLTRTPGSLKRDGISMRNIRGDFIRSGKP